MAHLKMLQVRQTMNVGADKGFQPTTNARNEAMLNEAGEFASHLKRCEKDIRGLKTMTEGLLNTTKIVMSAPLPRVYELGEGGKAVAVPPPPGTAGIIGGDFKGDDLTRSSKETSKKLDSEVLAPMQRWTTAYNTVLGRMKRLEGVRLEVDSRQRTVSGLTTTLNKQRATLPPSNTQLRSKGEVTVDTTIRKLTNKDNKLAATRQSFKEQEALVYQQLAQLIKDAVWLKSYLQSSKKLYLQAVMRLEQEAFTQAYVALGTSKASPVIHPHMEQMQMPGTPTEAGGMIQAARPMDGGPQAGATMGRTVASKLATGRKMLGPNGGKENGSMAPVHMGGPPGKEYNMGGMPAAPTHPINPRRQEGRGYDRYEYPAIPQQHPEAAPALPAW